jgi:hypothetical protein
MPGKRKMTERAILFFLRTMTEQFFYRKTKWRGRAAHEPPCRARFRGSNRCWLIIMDFFGGGVSTAVQIMEMRQA